jgi:hypothetical protein
MVEYYSTHPGNFEEGMAGKLDNSLWDKAHAASRVKKEAAEVRKKEHEHEPFVKDDDYIRVSNVCFLGQQMLTSNPGFKKYVAPSKSSGQNAIGRASTTFHLILMTSGLMISVTTFALGRLYNKRSVLCLRRL